MFILRRGCIVQAMDGWKAGRFLEVGAGTGRLTMEFLERGFGGVCYDLGAENRDLLRKNLAPYRTDVEVVDSLSELAPASFDYLFAFEVLEHIENDLETLRSWVQYLRPGGHVLVSVPAHMRKYSDEDRAVGHFRRYERAQLNRVLADAGFAGVRILAYGFPLATITRRGNHWLNRYKKSNHAGTAVPEELSIRSGVERSEASQKLAGLLNRRTLWPFCALQRLFFNSDVGDGYVALAALGETTRHADGRLMPLRGG